MRGRTPCGLAGLVGLVGLVGLDLGCGATLDDDPAAADAPGAPVDTAPAVDAPVAPPDARACAGGDGACPVGDGSCLVLFNTARTFAAARDACLAFDAQLAILDSAARDAAAKELVGTAEVFFGATDAATEGSFLWVDGTAIGPFLNFSAGEPNNANGTFEEDCLIYAGARPGWDDRPCAPIAGVNAPGEYPYLCQF